MLKNNVAWANDTGFAVKETSAGNKFTKNRAFLNTVGFLAEGSSTDNAFRTNIFLENTVLDAEIAIESPTTLIDNIICAVWNPNSGESAHM